MTAPAPGPVIVARHISRTYGARGRPSGGVVEATVTVAAGEIVGIQGPSGAGKSTLLRLLSGVEKPDHGELFYAGHAAWSHSRRWRSPRRAVYPRPGYVMPIYQDPFASLDPRWPVWRTVAEPLTARRSRGGDNHDHRATVRALLARSGMAHVDIDARPGELSGGQCQRIAIVRAIIAKAALIVADEPTARQDVMTAAAMTDQLRDAAVRGAAIIVVSHNTAWLASFSHRVCDLVDGRLSCPTSGSGPLSCPTSGAGPLEVVERPG